GDVECSDGWDDAEQLQGRGGQSCEQGDGEQDAAPPSWRAGRPGQAVVAGGASAPVEQPGAESEGDGEVAQIEHEGEAGRAHRAALPAAVRAVRRAGPAGWRWRAWSR